MKKPIKYIICTFLCLLIFSGNTYAGKLDDFEKDVKKQERRKGKKSDSSSGDFIDSCLGDAIGDIFIEGVAHLMIAGGAMSMARIDPRPKHSSDEYFKARKMGEPLIPYLRLDISHREVESDLSAKDYHGEIGYGALAILYKKSHFEEETPADELDIEQKYILYRMSLDSHVEVGFGIGEFIINGNKRQSKASITLPIRIHPSDSWGVELRPAWSDGLNDYDAAILFNRPYVSLKMGYRWVKSTNESLNGPYVGISLRL